jgi:NAD(P)-dependent dehydrogenase (short-subunit alcohol dehydrogenase family)
MSRYPAINLEGAVVAITGGARGIGEATAKAFAAKGARVAIGDLDLDLAKRAADDFGGTGHYLDVSEKGSYAAFLDEVASAHGDLDVLVNNAGLMPNGSFLQLDDATDRLQFDVNVFGVINGLKLALPGMIARGRGHVVNVASLAGKFPVKGLAVYNATKFAVVGLSAATRLEMEPHGVSISAILPGAVDTGLASGLSMAPIPKVPASAVADAVVGTVRTRKAETAVPSYVGGLASVATVTPEPVLRRFRQVMRDDRALKGDAAARQAYIDRINQQKQ